MEIKGWFKKVFSKTDLEPTEKEFLKFWRGKRWWASIIEIIIFSNILYLSILWGSKLPHKFKSFTIAFIDLTIKIDYVEMKLSALHFIPYGVSFLFVNSLDALRA